MAKAKSPKFGLSLLNSFQICRPKKPCSMIKSPLPHASYMLSPLNSKTFDISFPSTPLPPPSTPSKITPLPSASRSKSCSIQDNYSSRLDCEFPWSLARSEPRNQETMYKSTYSSSSDNEPDWRVSASRTDKKKDKNTKYKSKSCIRSRISSSGDETDSLFSSPPSFNSSHQHPLKTVYEEELINGSKKQTTTAKPRRFKRYGSKEWREGEEYNEKKPILGKLAPCMSDQSFVVVKKSVNPYEDFKKSMSEMILEKQIFEPKELEQLLMSFLSLNSRLHHKVIIEAFTEILKEVFCG